MLMESQLVDFHGSILIGLLVIGLMLLGEFKHEVRQFEKSYDNQQAEQISLMV